MKLAGPIAFALALSIACAFTAACNGGDKRMPSPPKSPAFTELSVPDVELFLEPDKAFPNTAWGAARVDGRTLRGKDAFDAVRPKVAGDATALATLAMLFLDEGVSGKKPWTQVDGPQVAAQQAIAKPPAVSGDTLVYWRFHVQTADLVRCRVALATGKVSCELGGDVLQAERTNKDPAGTAKDYLASDNVYTRTRGIEALGKVGDDKSRQQLIDFALNAYTPVERKAAVDVLGKTPGTGVVAALGRVLLYDQSDDVRESAATALGELRDPTARDALQKAEAGDADGRVRVLATEALKKLK